MEQVEGCYGCRMLARRAADAQATIAALQVRVHELEQWVQDQSTANLETMRHTDEMQSRAMEAEQQLTQRTAELEAAKRERDVWYARYNELSGVKDRQLNDLQAELEAIEKILDIDTGKTTVEKVRDLRHSFKQVWESYQDASNEMFKAQAELERVRGELAETKEVEVALSSKVAEYEVELNGDPQNFYGRGRTVGLRTLIAANKETKHDAI